MTLYDKLEANEELRVVSDAYGISYDICLKSRGKYKPIHVQFESGRCVRYTIDGQEDTVMPDSFVDIRIYEP